MKDALLWDKFVREIDVIYFEIEAIGLMNLFPYLVIYSIYNYLDSYKNKE
jgi:hypothetical protein